MTPPARTKRILRRLEAAYGPRVHTSRGKAVDLLVDTILSQNTSNKNSDAGYRRLRRAYRSWNQVMNAAEADVERCIRVCGLSRIKAPRIQQILRSIKGDRGRIDLEFLKEMDDQAALDYLTQFPGVGPKTAACTLMFAFGKAVFPVDTHIHRITRRLELIPAKASATRAQELLTPLIAPQDRYAMHVLLIAHGRKTCRAISPKCEQCTLLSLCPWGQQRMKAIDSGDPGTNR